MTINLQNEDKYNDIKITDFIMKKISNNNQSNNPLEGQYLVNNWIVDRNK